MGVIGGGIAILALVNDKHDAGGFCAIASGIGFLIGSLLSIKWVKRAEIAGYK